MKISHRVGVTIYRIYHCAQQQRASLVWAACKGFVKGQEEQHQSRRAEHEQRRNRYTVVHLYLFQSTSTHVESSD